MLKLAFKEVTKGLTNEEIRRCVTMVTYRYFDRRLNDALGEYADYGFRLNKSSYNTVDLFFKDKKLATYFADKANMAVIREGCKNYLASLVRNQK